LAFPITATQKALRSVMFFFEQVIIFKTEIRL